MGAHFNGSWKGAPKFLKDSLHIDITQMYGQPYLHEIFYPTKLSDARGQWFDSLRKQFWTGVKNADVKVILQPGNVSAIAKGSEMSEVYFDQARGDTIHRIDFSVRDTTHLSRIDRPKNSFVGGGVFPRSLQDTLPLMMAGAPNWTAMGIAQKGYYMSTQSADSGKYDIAVALKIDTTTAQFTNLNPDSLIAYVKVYRRIPVGQGICDCNLFEYVGDSLRITKAVYLDKIKSDTNAGNNYRDVTFTFRITDTTISVGTPLNIVLGPGDIVPALSVTTYPKYVPRGGWLGWHHDGTYQGDTSAAAPRFNRYCGLLRLALVANNHYYNAAKVVQPDRFTDHGDFGYEVYTTRKVDVTFMRGRIAPHTYAMLRHGDFNDTIKKSINAVFNDTTLSGTMNKQMFRFGVVDEHAVEKYRGYMDVASRVQDAIHTHDPNDTRGIWANPQADGPSLRLLSGDLDTTRIRMISMMADQWYNYGGLIPVTYANPDSMNGSAALTEGLYRAKDDPVTGAARSILYNTNDDYGIFLHQTLASVDTTINNLSAMINASRFQFRHIRRESYPVYSVVQVHGYLNPKLDVYGNVIGYQHSWFFPIVTPEEITVQAFVALNTGVDGLWLSDFTFDMSGEFGVMHWLYGADTNGHVYTSNYQDTLNSGDPYKAGDPNWVLPTMWTGFNCRYYAVKRVMDDFYKNIIPVYQKLDHNGIRMNLWRDHNFWAMPMIDTIYTMRADTFKVAGKYKPKLDGAGAKVYDRQDSTFMVATLFSPGLADTNRYSRYLLLTNVRCWPYDEKHYGPYVSSFHANDTVGFGAIDVRKPVVVLKNSTGVIADSVRVQSIGDTTSHVYAFGDKVELDFLDPGWGEMYKITPVIKPISSLGTAYNNAVHSLNPSVDSAAHDRLFVYQRDSIIYLRSLDGHGRWGKEYRISDSSDMVTVTVNKVKRNTADNLFPAIDMVRSNGTSCAIVWERRTNPGNQVTVEMAWLPFKPTKDTFPPANTILRRHLSAPRQFSQSWMQLTPSIVGVDSGYVVSWAAPDYTTEIKAVRDKPDSTHLDTSRVLRVKLLPKPPLVLDSATAYPTLAYTQNWQEVALNDGMISGPNDSRAFESVKAHIDGIPDTMGYYQIAHLAYQQGARSGSNSFYIMYNQIGVRFPDRNVGIPELWSSPTEAVTHDVAACTRLYPSIAVDSLHVGITFTILAPPVDPTPTSYVLLRFRDMAPSTPFKQRWATIQYSWGGKQGGQTKRFYERSSMTMFPARNTTSMARAYEGGMTWQWINAPSGREHGVKLYRFGEFTSDSLPDGAHPTMMLVPGVGDNANHAMKSTGIFRRGPSVSQLQMLNQRNQARWYNPGYFDNTPVAPIEAFGTTPPTDTIHAEGTLRKSGPFTDCSVPPSATVTTTIVLFPPHKYKDPDTVGVPPTFPPTPPWNEWGMPPTFFPKKPIPEKPVISVADLGEIQRTPAFPADSSNPKITRIMAGSDSLISWLNSQPNDSLYGIPANIFYMMQIVRESDSVVLWMGDTISARGIGSDTIEEEVTIPIGSVTTPGTKIFVRLATRPTNGLSYELIGGFHFIDDGASGTSSAKRVVNHNNEATGIAGATIGVRMIPNPLHTTTGELHITVSVPGSATISVFDLLGNRVMTLPSIEIKRPGEYAVPVDLSTLRDGVYVVDVRSGNGRGLTRITLIR